MTSHEPALSIIVPHYNMTDTLPRLLDSIAGQSFKDLEVILVDDGSRESCAAIARAYAERGMDLRLLELSSNRGTKYACLAGTGLARGRMFTFASADDCLYGTANLEQAVNLFRRENPDILHCNTLVFDRDKQTARLWQWGKPLAPRLERQQVFAAYVREELRAHSLSDKLFSRELWTRVVKKGEKSPVRFEGEDFMLLSLLFAECRKYIGSDIVFHHYIMTPSEVFTRRSAAYVRNFWATLNQMLRFLTEKNFPQDIIAAYGYHTCRYILKRFQKIDEGLCAALQSGDEKGALELLVGLHTLDLETIGGHVMRELKEDHAQIQELLDRLAARLREGP